MATCSYCYTRGHTRRTCPTLDRHIQDNPDGYEARKRQRELANKKPRKCSYCSEPGHTKRTCGTLKSDRMQMRARISDWRKRYLDNCLTTGFAPGTLLKFVDEDKVTNYYTRGRLAAWIEKHGSYAMVVRTQKDQLDHRQEGYSKNGVIVRFPGGYEMQVQLPIEFSHLMDQHSNPYMEIAGKVDALDYVVSLKSNNDWREGYDTQDYHLRI